MADKLLGDQVKYALAAVGITEERVKQRLGACKCEEWRQKLNQLDRWARRVISGKRKDAEKYLDEIIGSDEQSDKTD